MLNSTHLLNFDCLCLNIVFAWDAVHSIRLNFVVVRLGLFFFLLNLIHLWWLEDGLSR